MAAKVVYQGVGGGGDLFEGMKFFLMQRIPSRDKWEGLILVSSAALDCCSRCTDKWKENGGTIVQLEKQADMIIADHARKECPPGSISWKYIDQSVQQGELLDIEDFRAGPATKTIREVGSGLPTRKGRTPFTDADDRILMEWCVKAEQKGIALKGNDLFIQLEAKVGSAVGFCFWRRR